jgi:hypothetical protein
MTLLLQEVLGGPPCSPWMCGSLEFCAKSKVRFPPNSRLDGLLNSSRAAQLGDWRSEFDVEDRVRHCDGLIDRWAIPFFEGDFVCYRVTE